jgi:hypothetical protein
MLLDFAGACSQQEIRPIAISDDFFSWASPRASTREPPRAPPSHILASVASRALKIGIQGFSGMRISVPMFILLGAPQGAPQGPP